MAHYYDCINNPQLATESFHFSLNFVIKQSQKTLLLKHLPILLIKRKLYIIHCPIKNNEESEENPPATETSY